MIPKDDENERPVPTEWRSKFREIVCFLGSSNPCIRRLPDNVELPHHITIIDISRNIVDYGEELIELPEEAWETSIFLWMNDYWDVLIDLFTKDEGRSDLVLHARVFETGLDFKFVIDSVHVP